MSVTLGFQTNSGANVSFFNVSVPKDGKQYKLPDLITSATNQGQSVQVPSNFIVNQVLLSDPVQLSKNGTVQLQYPSGVSSHVASTTLNANTNTATLTSGLTQFVIIASK